MSKSYSAFPVCSHGGVHEHQVFDTGMSFHDWIVGQTIGPVMRGLMERRGQPGYDDHGAAAEAARLSIEIADNVIGLLYPEPGEEGREDDK